MGVIVYSLRCAWAERLLYLKLNSGGRNNIKQSFKMLKSFVGCSDPLLVVVLPFLFIGKKPGSDLIVGETLGVVYFYSSLAVTTVSS